MSGARTSTFADPNLLLSTLSGAQTARVMQNQLLNQETAALMPYRVQEAQQTTGAADMEMMARASQGLLSLPDEASRAAAYPGVVASLQQQGYAKNAPSQYPGEARLRSIAMMGIPSVDLYKLQQANTALNAVWPGGGGTAAAPGGGGTSTATTLPIPGRGTGGPGASAQLPPEYLPYVMEASQKYGLPPDLIIAQMRQESGFNADATGKAGEIGLMQIMPSTARNPGMGMDGVDPATLTGKANARNNIMFGAAYLRAHMGNGDPRIQRRRRSELRRQCVPLSARLGARRSEDTDHDLSGWRPWNAGCYGARNRPASGPRRRCGGALSGGGAGGRSRRRGACSHARGTSGRACDA